jgi:hypothetical protein
MSACARVATSEKSAVTAKQTIDNAKRIKESLPAFFIVPSKSGK